MTKVSKFIFCSSGERALNQAASFQPELILLDVMMRVMDGPETLKGLRELPGLESTPVAFLTAKVQPSEIEEFMAMGALEVIAKPFDPMTLGDQIRGLLARHDV
jgi:two-component system, OmpR family, response regulator